MKTKILGLIFIILIICVAIISAFITPLKYPSELTSEKNISNDEINLTLYKYDAKDNDYEKPSEKKIFSVKRENFEKNKTQVLNDMFKDTEIKFNNVTIETNCIKADIPQSVVNKFDGGSAIGNILTHELIITLLNLPDIQRAIITVDGNEGCCGNHYNLNGIFIKDGEIKYIQKDYSIGVR